jgi:hypothetical protein
VEVRSAEVDERICSDSWSRIPQCERTKEGEQLTGRVGHFENRPDWERTAPERFLKVKERRKNRRESHSKSEASPSTEPNGPSESAPSRCVHKEEVG